MGCPQLDLSLSTGAGIHQNPTEGPGQRGLPEKPLEARERCSSRGQACALDAELALDRTDSAKDTLVLVLD